MAKRFTKHNLLLDFQDQLKFMERNVEWWIENGDYNNTDMQGFKVNLGYCIKNVEALVKRSH